MRQRPRLVMISLDAVSSDDLRTLLELPHFASLRSRGTLVRDVRSVFVSNTYPAHTSIITGMHPAGHGLTDNHRLPPGSRREKWRFSRHEIQAPTLYDRAAERGLSVCSILYPVTGGAGIRWNIPEVPGPMSIPRRAYTMLKAGSPGFLLASLLRFGWTFRGKGTAGLDDLTTRIAADALVRHKPDLLLLHLVDADSRKHDFGPASPEAVRAFERHDRRIGTLLEALRQAGTDADTAILVFSDHGCLPVERAVDPNRYLEDCGFIRKRRGRLLGFDAFFHCAGGSAFLRVYDPAKKEAVLQAAERFLEQPYVGRKLTAEELRISGMDREHVFGIEAADGCSFGKTHRGQHGYTPEREGYYPFYLAVPAPAAANAAESAGRTMSGGCITDICPLAAELLGIPLWEMDGVNRLRQ